MNNLLRYIKYSLIVLTYLLRFNSNIISQILNNIWTFGGTYRCSRMTVKVPQSLEIAKNIT